jgi:hypothetical protein
LRPREPSLLPASSYRRPTKVREDGFTIKLGDVKYLALELAEDEHDYRSHANESQGPKLDVNL